MAFLDDSMREIGNRLAYTFGVNQQPQPAPISQLPIYEPGSKDYVNDLKSRNGGLKLGRDDKQIESYAQQIQEGGLSPDEADIIIARNPSAAGVFKAAKQNRAFLDRLQSIRDSNGNFDAKTAQQEALKAGQFGVAKELREISPDLQGLSAVQSTMVLDNGNIGTVMRTGQVVDTGVKARGYAMRPLETDAGVFNYNPSPGQGQSPISQAPIIGPSQIAAGAAQKAGAVETATGTAKTAVARAAGEPQAETNLSAQSTKTGILGDLIGQAKNQAGMFTTGFIGSQAAKVAGTPAYDLARTLDTIRANIGFDKLQELRNSSPTGGALGQVSEQEHRLLQAVWGALDQSQSKAQFVKNLDRVQTQINASWARVAKAYQQTYGKPLPPEYRTSGGDSGPPDGVDPQIWDVMTPEEKKLWQN